MGRGGKVRNNFKKRFTLKDEGSDDSDEDYVVSEEGNEESDDDAEDYCSSLDDCAWEDGFGSFADEEEEEKEMRNGVSLKAKRMSSARERKIVNRKSRKWKSVSDEEEEDEDFEEEEEKEMRNGVSLKAKRMSSSRERKIVNRKSRKWKSVSDEEEEDEDYEEEEEGNEEYDDDDDDAEDYCSSLDECASEEGFESFVNEEEEKKELRKVARLKAEQISSARERKIVVRKSRKRKSVSDDEEDDEDYEEEDEEEEEEDDDEEFTLDKEDCLDEEEELTMKKKKKNKKVSKQGLQKRGPSKHRKKRKKSAVSKKPPLRKQGRKKRGLKRKKRAEEDDDDDDGDYCDFIDNTQIVRKKSSTNAGRRKKAYIVPSDSDFVSSGSSDYEYTISEEEREQVKEANQLCGSLKTSLRMRSSSSSKRIQEFEELGQHTPRRKGKEKVEEIKAEVIKPVCGICLSEEDKRRLRGALNCCNHYFCFTCIMEWSKVESRCPLCKNRFETISKPARSTAGVDLRDVVIQVPKRDQVYQPSEEELRSYLDPYENVICSECHQGGDDELMLLCDICDSSAHTYCVGLGREVPEGNWYCDGCRPVALGSSSSQVQDSLPDQRSINNLYSRLSPIVNVGESLDSIIGPPRTPLTPGSVGLSSPRFPAVDIPATSPVSGVGAPTLTGRRWLHRQIQNLRSINRMNLMAGRTDGISTANMGFDFVNSHIDQSRETTVQQARMQDMGTQHLTVFEERLQNDPSSSLQSRDFFSSRLGHLRRQAVQDSITPTFNTSVNLTLWPEFAGISSNEQLRHCSSNGSNIGPDDCGSPFSVRNEDNLSTVKERLQTMVRSHLKALSNNIDLDNGTVKDIATSSMHTVFAACGLEHRRSEVHIVPPPSNCTHMERVATGRASLMKGCCFTCFDSFVKDVVKRIMDTRSPQWLSLGL